MTAQDEGCNGEASMWWLLASAALGCPGPVERVEVAVGKSDPPATLVPEVNRAGGRYQLRTGLKAKTPADQVSLTCFGRGKPVVVALPPAVNRCELRDRRVRCR